MNKVSDFEALIATKFPNIVAVTETFWTALSRTMSAFPTAFPVISSWFSHHRSGVMIAVRDSMPYTCKYHLENADIELLWLQVTCNNQPIVFDVFIGHLIHQIT